MHVVLLSHPNLCLEYIYNLRRLFALIHLEASSAARTHAIQILFQVLVTELTDSQRLLKKTKKKQVAFCRDRVSVRHNKKELGAVDLTAP